MARQQSESRSESRQQGSQSLEPRRQNQLQRETAPMFSPFSMMRRMVEDMDRMFEGFGGSRSNPAFETFLPSVDLFERDGKVIVRADLPGMNKDDVRVEMTEDAIVIEGERKYEHEQNEQGVYRSERNYGRFYREIPLPDGVKTENATAKFKDGVLEVALDASEMSTNRRQIQIQDESTNSTSTNKPGKSAA